VAHRHTCDLVALTVPREDPVAHPDPGGARLRMWATVLVAFAASGLLVLVSSYSAFERPGSIPAPTSSIPAK